MNLSDVRHALRDNRPVEVNEPGTIPAAVAIVLIEVEGGLEVLFIERAERENDPWSRQIAFPGGRRDPDDADLAATAIRETREETGVELGQAERLAALNDMHPRTPVLPPVVVRPYVFGLPQRPEITPSDEVHAAFWVPLAILRAPGVHQTVTVTPRGMSLSVPAYIVGPHVIWGMTERILTPFLQRLPFGP
jgi:8-oxo-dGTP pyrophosphatase MutT (NUDIX family)